MPKDAPALKLEATQNYGAEVVFYDRITDDREQLVRELMERTGRVLVPPFDDPEIMAGQGTAALELLEDVPSLDVLLAPGSAAVVCCGLLDGGAHACSRDAGLRRRARHGQRHRICSMVPGRAGGDSAARDRSPTGYAPMTPGR
jgi:threonine dehydratase